MSRTTAYVRQTVVPSSSLLPLERVAFSIAAKRSHSREFFNRIDPNAVSQEFGKRISTCTVPLCLGRDYGPLARDQSVDVLSAATPGALPLVARQRRLRVAPRHSGTAFSSSCRS